MYKICLGGKFMFDKDSKYFVQDTYGNIGKNQDDSPDTLVDNYLKDNPETGFLIFRIFHDSLMYGRTPVQNAKITINAELGNGNSMEKVSVSDENGKTEPISLPTVNGQFSFDPGEDRAYSTYSAVVETADYLPVMLSNIPIFDNVTTIQPVSLMPKSNAQIPTFLEVHSNYFGKAR